jgi:DNA-binding transcriptional ArsR family regulator
MEAAIKALAEPNRRRILELVASRELSAGEIAAEFEVTRPAVSQHLGVLRSGGFVHVRVDGPRRVYSLDPTPLRAVHAWLDHFRRFWDQHLDALGTEIARGKRARRQEP